MRIRTMVPLVGLVLFASGCDGEPLATSSTTSSLAPTTTTEAPATTTSTSPPSPSTTTGLDVTAQGLGDRYFPDLGNPGYDVDHYTLDLVFDPAVDRLAATATIEALATASLDEFNLDFSGFEIDAVTVDGVEADYGRLLGEMTVAPAAAIPSGEAFVVAVSYSGTPQAARSNAIPFTLGWQTGPAGTRFVVAEPDAAHTWFPSNDHPLDKATYTFRITVPDPLIAAANGVLVDEIRDLGQATWVWEMTDPMATYLATIVIGDHVIVNDAAATQATGVPIRHVLPPAMAADPPPSLARLPEMFDLLTERFGPYPFAVYGIAAVDGFGAALENQTLSLFGVPFPPETFAEVVMIHELAHQWFGNSVSPARWEDIWLNEGFASYAEWLWLEREVGRAEVEAGIAAERQAIAESGFAPAGDPGVSSMFGVSVYRVGAMALHALRLGVGDDTFFEILRAYHDRFAGGSATTDDFIAVAEELSGQDLEPLFDAWLYSTELPEF